MEFIEKCKNKMPPFASELDNLGTLYDQKLWHQLCLALISLLKNPSVFHGPETSQLYTEFISLFENKLNGVQFVTLLSMIGTRLGNLNDELALYQKILHDNSNKSSGKKLDFEGEFCLKMCIAYVQLELGNLNESKQLLEEAKQIMQDSKIGHNNVNAITESAVFSKYYRASAQYQKVLENYNEFYSTALLYLSYTDIEELTDAEKFSLTVDIALAGLISDSIFDFAVFLSSPLMKLLDNNYSWLKSLILHMNNGDVKLFLQEIEKSMKQIQLELPKILENQKKIHNKVIYLAVLNLVLHLNPHDRNIPFTIVSEQCLIPVDQVEWILMKLMSLKLLKGQIDEVNQTIAVNWIQPRELDLTSVKGLSNQLNSWNEHVKNALMVVEENSPELYV